MVHFNPSNPTSVRFTGRQVRMRVEGDQSTNWRVGTMRLEIKAGGIGDNASYPTSHRYRYTSMGQRIKSFSAVEI